MAVVVFGVCESLPPNYLRMRPLVEQCIVGSGRIVFLIATGRVQDFQLSGTRDLPQRYLILGDFGRRRQRRRMVAPVEMVLEAGIVVVVVESSSRLCGWT